MSRRKRSTAVISRSATFAVSSGNAAVGVAVDPQPGDRMCAVFTCIDVEGRFIRVALTPHDVLHLCRDAQRLLGATSEEINAWWRQLRGSTQDAVDAAPGVDYPRG